MNGSNITCGIAVLLLLALALCPVCQGAFRPMYHVVTEIDRPACLCVADLNSDGSVDVVVGSDAAHVMGWCANDGSGHFGALQVIADDVDGVTAACAADLDGDGDLDLISSDVSGPSYPWRNETASSTISWYANDGSGQFGPSQTITTETGEIQSVRAADVDTDGDLDIVFSAIVSDPRDNPRPVSSPDPGDDDAPSAAIGWYANDGTGRFAPQQAITSEPVEPQSLCVADLDGDDNLDVLAVLDEYEIARFRNNGQGQFGAAEAIHISTVRINSLCTADLNGDGSLDLLVASDGRWSDPSLAWHANDGTGTFGPIQEIPIGIDTPHNGTYAVNAVDVDRDGDLDVIAVPYRCAHVCSCTMTWYANDGTGQFSFQQIIGHASDYGSFSTLFTADLDNDEDLDILAASLRDDEVRWFENGGLGYGPQVVISTDMDLPNGVSAADLDGDGDLDVLATSCANDAVAWYENKGSRQFGPKQVIYAQPPTIVRGPIDRRHICPADLDGDGDIDIASSFRDADGRFMMFWHENDGSGTFDIQQVSAPEDYAAISVLAADLDGDGDLDILGSGGVIFWYANNGSGQFGPMQVITLHGTVNLLAADLDGDGDVDVVSTLNWYENDGTGQFGPKRVISTNTDGVNCVHAADLDGDGDLDMLAAAYRYYTGGKSVRYIAWYENDGSGQFGPMRLVSSDVWAVQSIDVADLDDDGDADVLMAAHYENKVAWFENDGTGHFGDQQVIYDRAEGVECIHAADMDGDGDMDVLSASSTDNAIALYDNE